jgi:hypothetical protein
MKGLFEFHIDEEGRLRPKSEEDFRAWKKEHVGKEFIGYFYEKVRIGEKKRMYNFFQGPVLDRAKDRLLELGHYNISKDRLKDEFKQKFLGSYYQGIDDEERVYTPSLASLTKDELRTFIDQVLHFMQEDMETDVPDPGEYKVYLRTGKNYTNAKRTDQ